MYASVPKTLEVAFLPPTFVAEEEEHEGSEAAMPSTN